MIYFKVRYNLASKIETSMLAVKSSSGLRPVIPRRRLMPGERQEHPKKVLYRMTKKERLAYPDSRCALLCRPCNFSLVPTRYIKGSLSLRPINRVSQRFSVSLLTPIMSASSRRGIQLFSHCFQRALRLFRHDYFPWRARDGRVYSRTLECTERPRIITAKITPRSDCPVLGARMIVGNKRSDRKILVDV